MHDAITIINNWSLEAYQLFFDKGLTTSFPSRKWVVGLDFCPGFAPNLKLSYLLMARHVASGITIYDSMPEKLLQKALLLEEAINKGREKCDPRVCCPLASKVNCVCMFSYSCPIHGKRCFGSHE